MSEYWEEYINGNNQALTKVYEPLFQPLVFIALKPAFSGYFVAPCHTLYCFKPLFYKGFRNENYSHSIVAGGLLEISKVTLEIPEISLIILVET